MRIGLISDIHGNLVALETVLADLEAQAVDQIICLGDTVATGPQPHATLERLRALNCPVVMGNTDEWLLDPPAVSPKPDLIQAIDHWCVAQLSAEDLAFLRSFQPTIAVELGPGMTLLCVHGSPRSNIERIEATTSDEQLSAILAEESAQVIASGHTHVQMLRRYQDRLLINPGSVGMPFEHDSAGAIRNPPWAEYGLLSYHDGHLSIELRRVPLDLQAVIQAALDSDMPYQQEWIADWR
ncbi:MAG: metallophosphoesterase family protein [Chloroflexi bacterium]|nr:metallophosphoesterase family protein [Chloroflexota bacterium]